MKKIDQRPLPACVCAALFLALPAAPAVADAPAVTVVRQFLTDRATGRSAAGYALLSVNSQRWVPAGPFAQGDPPAITDDALPPAVLGVIFFFWDVHTKYDLSSLTFSVAGPDPADPQVVLVQAVPSDATGHTDALGRPDAPDPAHALTLHVLTVPDPQTHTLRLDLLGSMQHTERALAAALPQRLGRMISLCCLNDLASGIIGYAQSHELRLPDAAHWMDQIRPYVKNSAAFQDPSGPAGQKYSYAYNRALSGKPLPFLEKPNATVLVFESRLGVKNASDTGQSVPHPGRHLGGTGYAFVSGHVAWLPDGMKPSFKLTGK